MAYFTLTQDFLDEVITSLGGTLVDVELTNDDYRLCFNKAKRTFHQKGHYGYKRDFYTLPVTKGDQVFSDIPDDIEDIIRIIKPSYGSTLSSVSFDDPFSYQVFNQLFNTAGYNRADFTSYELALGLAEERSKYFVHEVQFEHDPFSNTLRVLKPASVDTSWLLDCYRKLNDEELQQIDWVIRWTVAEAKIVLGMAYRKFDSLPSPMGQTSLNGQSYIEEGNRDKEMLLEEIEMMTDGANDFVEIRFG
jgi:hypothetical protein